MKLKIFLLTLLTTLQVVRAQQPDSLSNVNFNALEHVLQDRYIPTRKDLHTQPKRHRLQLSLNSGISRLYKGSSMNPNGIDFGLSATYQWAPLHHARIATTFSLAKGEEYAELGIQKRFGLEYSDLFNLLDFLQGYHPNRTTDLQTVVGLGTYYTRASRSKDKFSAGLHAGLHLTHAIYDHLYLFLEPRATLYTDGYDALTGDQSSRRYHLGAQLLIGTTYTFRNMHLPTFPTNEMYIEYYAGLQGDYSQRVSDYFGSSFDRFGPTLGLGIGKWYLPLGYRFTLFTGYHQVPKEAALEKTSNFQLGLRLEAMLNLNKLISPRTLQPRLEINAGAGYETSLFLHDKEGVLRRPHYLGYGPTLSAQFLYHLNHTYGLFLQGRYSHLQYTEHFADADTDNQSRKKQNLALEIGLQYRRIPSEARSHNHTFQPSTFIEIISGMNATVDTKHSTSLGEMLKSDHLGAQLGFRVGRQLSPYTTLRASLETSFMNIGSGEKAYPLTFAADYLLDLTTLFTHYRPDRAFILSPVIGIVYTHHNRGTSKWDTRITTRDGNYLGMTLGLNQHFRINDRWGIYLEETVRIYKGKFNAGAPTYTKLDLNTLLNCQLGIRYRL